MTRPFARSPSGDQNDALFANGRRRPAAHTARTLGHPWQIVGVEIAQRDGAGGVCMIDRCDHAILDRIADLLLRILVIGHGRTMVRAACSCIGQNLDRQLSKCWSSRIARAEPVCHTQ